MPKCLYYQGVRIKRALRYKVKDMCFINKKTKADIFTATNCTLALISLNYGNLIVIYHTLNEICTSNQAKILTALNHCSVSSANWKLYAGDTEKCPLSVLKSVRIIVCLHWPWKAPVGSGQLTSYISVISGLTAFDEVERKPNFGLWLHSWLPCVRLCSAKPTFL